MQDLAVHLDLIDLCSAFCAFNFWQSFLHIVLHHGGDRVLLRSKPGDKLDEVLALKVGKT